MKRDLDQLFDQCISQLNNGVDVETILENFAEEAAELRPLLRTVALVRQVPPPAASSKARARGKRRLLRAVAARKRARAEAGNRTGHILDQVAAWLQPLLQPQARLRRLALTIASLLVVVTMTGWSVTLVAANSLPNSPLYPIKLATEEIRLTLTTSSTARAQIQFDRAERRYDELQTLIETGRKADETVLRAAQHQSRAAWEAIAVTPEETRESLLSHYSNWAQERQSALKEARTQLPPQEQAIVDEAIKSLSVDIELAEKALRWSPTPSPATETPTNLPAATHTVTQVATKTATRTSTPQPTRPPATATVADTPAPPTGTPIIGDFPVYQPDLKPTRPATATRTATTTPQIPATPIRLTATATPSVILPPTATPTESSEIMVPTLQPTPFQTLPTPTATPTPDEPPQVGQPPVQATTVPLASTPTP